MPRSPSCGRSAVQDGVGGSPSITGPSGLTAEYSGRHAGRDVVEAVGDRRGEQAELEQRSAARSARRGGTP